MIGIFCSGSRGAYMGFLASTAAFLVVWSVRKALKNKTSLMPAIVGLTGVISFAIIIALIIVWPRAHNLVLGGGMEAYSIRGALSSGRPECRSLHRIRLPATASRWAASLSNKRGFISIDSYILSLLIETGVPGLFFLPG